MLAWQQLRANTKSLTFPPLAVARYSIIQLGQLGRQWRERKCPIFETVAKGDSNPGSLDCESGILPLSYRAPVWVGTNLRENLLTRSNALVGSMTFAFNSAMYNDICCSLRFYCSCRNENIMSTVDISARIPRMPHCYSGYTLRQRLEADQYCGSTCQICVSVWHCMVTIRYALPDPQISGGKQQYVSRSHSFGRQSSVITHPPTSVCQSLAVPLQRVGMHGTMLPSIDY